MDENMNELWRGGPWEQPSPAFTPPPAVRIPARAMSPRRPVLRPRRKRERKWPWFLGVLLLIGAICLVTWLVRGQLRDPAFRGRPHSGWDDSWLEEQREYRTDPPSIPRSETGTGVTVSLQPPAGQPLSYSEIYEKSAPSMVSIESQGPDGYASGTGIVLTQDGYLITNAHVVAGCSKVRVALSDNSVLDASLVGFDANEDIAVLKIEAAGLTPAEFGDSLSLKIGDPVAALGDPLGYRSTLTDGIVSALDREVDVDGVTMVLIQTSAAINFGNSGGALLNQYGQVVGVTTVKIISEDGSVEALGFAIPSRRVKYVADALIAGREIKTGVFGFTVYTFPAEGGGLEVLEVDPLSDAQAKGLREGDVITAVNGQPVSSTQDLVRLKQGLGPGDEVDLTYRRDGETFTVTVALVDAELIEQEG